MKFELQKRMSVKEEHIVIKVHRVEPNGKNKSIQLEINKSKEILSETVLKPIESVNFMNDENKLNLNHHRFTKEKSPTITLIKIGDVDELNPLKYATKVNKTINKELGKENYKFTETDIEVPARSVTIPSNAAISCQNCETTFPNKYQYQRHQCEFNADKVILKPEIAGKDFDKATRLKFECDVCNKPFVSNNNLERHKNCHKNDCNVCEFCKKSFVSENRLKIHKENHCKKAGDTAKFYRSDMVVWKCVRCQQVFATQDSANKHAAGSCMENVLPETEPTSAKIKKEIEDEGDETPSTETGDKNQDNNFDTNFEQAMSNQSESIIKPDFYKNTDPLSIDDNNEVIKKIVTEVLFQCEFCNRTYSSKQSVVDHQKWHTTEKNYECIFCGQQFDYYTHATAHWQHKCSRESNLFYLPKLVYCEHCDRGYKSHDILYSHRNKKKHYTLKIHHGGDNGERSDNERAIVKMIENMMTKIDQNDETNKEPTEDEVVKKKKRGRKRKWHKTQVQAKSVEDGYRYQCERCAAVFDSVANLEAHKDTEHTTIFTCEQCGQIVHSAKALVIHGRAHQSLKPYVCDQCGRSYSQTSHLWQHMRFHQGIKPFACPHEGCEARYTIRPDLKDHIRKVHTRERPFKCSVCNKCFLTGSVYYQHRLIHTNDRRYGCETCGKRFFRADALNNHRRIHTDERPYSCHVCGREFRQKGDRNKHVRTQHSL